MASNKDVFNYYKKGYLEKNFSDTPLPHTVRITKAQRDAGAINRYFVHHISRPTSITEVSKDGYEKFKKNPYYTTERITWYIKGPKETIFEGQTELVGIVDLNKKNLQDALLTMPGLAYYITDYAQFWQE